MVPANAVVVWIMARNDLVVSDGGFQFPFAAPG